MLFLESHPRMVTRNGRKKRERGKRKRKGKKVRKGGTKGHRSFLRIKKGLGDGEWVTVLSAFQ